MDKNKKSRSITLSAKVDAETLSAIEAKVAASGQTQSQWLRDAISSKLNDEKFIVPTLEILIADVDLLKKSMRGLGEWLKKNIGDGG